MSLFKSMMVPCVFMEKKQTPDGSGGNRTKWTEAEPFEAAIIMDSSTESKIADAAGTVKAYTVTVSRSVPLKYHDVFKRVSDGQIFRITSDNETQTPLFAALDMAQSTAEAWRLT